MATGKLTQTIAEIQAILNSVSSYDDDKEAMDTLIDTKVDKVNGKGLSTNDYTTADKDKLSGIATGANKIEVDSSLSSTSTNPVQNKAVNSALESKSDTTHTHTTLGAVEFTADITADGDIQINDTELETLWNSVFGS